jgi:hypothetical protein
MLLFHAMFAWHAREAVTRGNTDFTTFYAAGAMVRDGFRHQLYDLETQLRFQSQVRAEGEVHGTLPFLHPPFEVPLFAALAYFSYPQAYLIWSLVNLTVLLGATTILRTHIPMLRKRPTWFWVVICLAYFPLFLGVLQGQEILLLLLVLTLTFVALKEDHDYTAGFWLGIGLFRFHTIVALVLMLAWQRKFRALASFAGVAFVWTLVSGWIVGWKVLFDYPAYVWRTDQLVENQGIIFPSLMPNLRGILDFLHGLRVPNWLMFTILLGGCAGLLCFGASKWKSANLAGSPLGFPLALNITILAGYYALMYDLSLVLLPIALVVNYVTENSDSIQGWRRLLLLGPVVILFFSPLAALLVIRGMYVNLLGLVLLFWTWQIGREITLKN